MGIRTQIMDDAGKAAIVREIDQTAADAHAATKFEEALHVLAVHARVMIGAQPAALSYIPRDNFHAAIHTHSFSKKYEKYNTCNMMPTDERIWGAIVEKKIPMRMAQEELQSHLRWNIFNDLKDKHGLEHPPMVGWLAVPILRQTGEFIGLLQLSEKEEGEFAEQDQATLARLGKVISPTFDLQHVTGEPERRTRQLAENNQELKRFNRLTVGREMRMIELDKQVNELSQELSRDAPYDLPYAEEGQA